MSEKVRKEVESKERLERINEKVRKKPKDK